MAQFEKMYFKLFNAVTTALRLLEKNEAAAAIEVLKHTQCLRKMKPLLLLRF